MMQDMSDFFFCISQVDNDARSESEDSESDEEYKNGVVKNGLVNGKPKTQ